MLLHILISTKCQLQQQNGGYANFGPYFISDLVSTGMGDRLTVCGCTTLVSNQSHPGHPSIGWPGSVLVMVSGSQSPRPSLHRMARQCTGDGLRLSVTLAIPP